jgi:hypothetical protein
MLMKRRRERGQAIFETALFIPLILLSMYGIFVISSEGSMSERVQLGVRNGGSIFAPGNPYLSFSTYNLYSSIDGVDPADPCSPPRAPRSGSRQPRLPCPPRRARMRRASSRSTARSIRCRATF